MKGNNLDLRGLQLHAQLAPAGLLIGGKPRDLDADSVELLGRREAIL
jgi:hypothetical protein